MRAGLINDTENNYSCSSLDGYGSAIRNSAAERSGYWYRDVCYRDFYVRGIRREEAARRDTTGRTVGGGAFDDYHRTAPYRSCYDVFKGDEASIDDPSGYHIAHAKIAIGSGGIDGVGIGNSVQAAGYLPEAINDSVFAILGETFGFIGLVFILAMFYLLLLRILRLVDRLEKPEYRLIVAGVFGWIASHVVINVAAMTGLMPLTGITLPFLSFGGTSMLFIAAALGVVFQISRYTVHTQIKEDADEGTRSRRGQAATLRQSPQSLSS